MELAIKDYRLSFAPQARRSVGKDIAAQARAGAETGARRTKERLELEIRLRNLTNPVLNGYVL